MNHLLCFVLFVTVLVGCADSRPGGSGVEVGSAGDNVVHEFKREGRALYDRLKNNPVPGVNAEEFREKVDGARLVSADRVFSGETEVQAVNFRHRSPQEIHISARQWEIVRQSAEQRSYLVLHEYLALMGIDDSAWEDLPNWQLVRLGLRPKPFAPRSYTPVVQAEHPFVSLDRVLSLKQSSHALYEPGLGISVHTFVLSVRSGFETFARQLSQALWNSPLPETSFLGDMPVRHGQYLAVSAGWQGAQAILTAPTGTVSETSLGLEVSGAPANELFQFFAQEEPRLYPTETGNAFSLGAIDCERARTRSDRAECFIRKDE